MNFLRTYHNLFYILLIIWGGLISCNTENYPEGDDKYSYVTSDLGTITTDEECKMRTFITDSNSSLALTKPIKTDWATTPDSTYRVLIRYEANTEEIKPFSIEPVFTIPFSTKLPQKEFDFDDPIHWESLWLSANAEYINMGITLMVGTDNGKEIGSQRLRVRYTKSSMFHKNGKTHMHHHLRLYHDQCDVPQYYSQSTFVSIPTHDITSAGSTAYFSSGDSITITAFTYQGLASRSVIMK